MHGYTPVLPLLNHHGLVLNIAGREGQSDVGHSVYVKSDMPVLSNGQPNT
jgi:hypothetical protein